MDLDFKMEKMFKQVCVHSAIFFLREDLLRKIPSSLNINEAEVPLSFLAGRLNSIRAGASKRKNNEKFMIAGIDNQKGQFSARACKWREISEWNSNSKRMN
uniref:Uncharacterized protein n=1 Tax=Romanomermis culicivorax TaxID=13658 RepID=A0A915KB62_ROMCU